ncbi:MAG: phenylalanine--tRNA ligase subunit beta [bacterium]
MKISCNWLQIYFEQELPNAEVLSDALTFHVFEIDGIEKVGGDDVLDVKVTPNRGHDCLSHAGIARELSAILTVPMKRDPLANSSSSDLSIRSLEPKLGELQEGSPEKSLVLVRIETPLCRRYIAGHMKGVKVGPSPDWLRSALESMGQKSINNIVDATNYVMFDLGQPLHAFDAGKLAPDLRLNLSPDLPRFNLEVRNAKPGEKLLALDEKEYALAEHMLVIADGNSGDAIGVAGVKGGKPAEISESTTEIIIESANFDGACVRKTAQALKLRTDASARFEQQLSPELAGYAMRAVIELIQKIAGGEVVGFCDVYPESQKQTYVSVTTEKINQVLGTALTGADVADVFQRLGFAYKEQEGVFEVQPPFQRLDLEISEDLVEEVGRIVGYDKVLPAPLPAFSAQPEINQNFAAAEKVREELVNQGCSEVFTSVFAEKGERVVLNKVDGVRPYMRTTLVDGLQDALKKNIPNKDLLGLKEIKLFEIGTVWRKGKEITMLGTIVEGEKATEKPLESIDATEYQNLPLSKTDRYQSFSKYPYIVRDVAFWTPTGTGETAVAEMIKTEAGGPPAGGVLQSIRLFDTFTKGDKTSLGFRLIFQSFEKTLTDDEVNPIMEKIYTKLKAEGFEIR